MPDGEDFMGEYMRDNPVLNEQDMHYDNCFVCGKLCRDTTDDEGNPVCSICKALIDGPKVVKVEWHES